MPHKRSYVDPAMTPQAPRSGAEGPAVVVAIEVVMVTGRAAGVEFHISRVDVEVWSVASFTDRCRCGVVGRVRLREWLAWPEGPLVFGEVVVTCDWMIDRRGRVAVTVPGVRAWVLAPHHETRLRERV